VKLFYEALEAVERELYDSLRAIGLRGLPLAVALFTHVKRQVVSHVLFMLEYNVRTATILGFVGAGGVGYYIQLYLSALDYAAAAPYVVATMVFVVAIDAVSYLLRRCI
jgi:phosphonate transport system permease protein